jgi:hypothetical protein
METVEAKVTLDDEVAPGGNRLSGFMEPIREQRRNWLIKRFCFSNIVSPQA